MKRQLITGETILLNGGIVCLVIRVRQLSSCREALLQCPSGKLYYYFF